MRGFPRISAATVCLALSLHVASAQTAPSSPAPNDPASRAAAARAQRQAKVASLTADAHKLYAAGQLKEAADLLRQATIIDPQEEDAALFFRDVMNKIANQSQDDLPVRRGRELLSRPIDAGDPTSDQTGRVNGSASPATQPAPSAIDGELHKAKAAALTAAARTLYDAGQFKEAADLLRQAYINDPENENVTLLFRLAVDKISEQEYRRILSTISEQVEPSTPPVTFAAQKRTAPSQPSGPIQLTPQERATRDRLEKNLKELTADKQSLAKVLAFLQDNMGVDIRVNWAALQDAGVSKTTPISVQLKDVIFRKALQTVLEKTQAATTLGYQVSDTTIIISTNEDFNSASYHITRAYDISDLLSPVPPGTQPVGPSAVESRKEQVETLIQTVKATIASDTWTKTGAHADVHEENGWLIVTQTKENHIGVYQLLRQLAETRSVSIRWTARTLLSPDTLFAKRDINWRAINQVTPSTNPASSTSPASAPNFLPRTALIDSFTLALLSGAAKEEKRALIATLPECQVGNGISALLNYPVPHRYLAELRGGPVPVQADPYLPVYAQTPSGIALTMLPIVASDRGSLSTQLELNVHALLRIDSVPPPNLPANTTLRVEKPVINSQTYRWSVEIPDGQTLLIDSGPCYAPDDLRHLYLLLTGEIRKVDLE